MKKLSIIFMVSLVLNGCNKSEDSSAVNKSALLDGPTSSNTSSTQSEESRSSSSNSSSILTSSKNATNTTLVSARVMDRTEDSITIAMGTRSSEVRGYKVLVNNREALLTTDNFATVEGLISNTHYALMVQALNESGRVLASSEIFRGTTLEESSNNGSEMGYYIPEKKILGNPTILASQASLSSTGRVEILRTGEVLNDVQNPLAEAMKRSIPGDVIGVSGHLSGVHIGKFGWGSQYVYWPNNAVIRDISIKSVDPSNPAIINHVKIQGNYRELGEHGVDDITFQDVRFKSNSQHESTPFNIYNTSVHGTVRLYNISLENNGHSTYAGTGLKWGMRAMGNVKFYDMRGITCPDRAEEHCLYLDGPGLDGNNADPQTSGGYFSDVVQLEQSGRTGIQIVNRASEDAATPAGGQLVIRNSSLLTRAGSGGSAVTVAGFLGAVYLENLDIDTDLGAIVVYSEQNHGLLYNENGYTTDFVKMKNININAPNAARSHIAISGVEEVEVVSPFNITGANKAFNFNTQYGGGINNGSVKFFDFSGLLSDYAGFNSATRIMDSGQVLSDSEINALQQ